jgi:hypothetical protein
VTSEKSREHSRLEALAVLRDRRRRGLVVGTVPYGYERRGDVLVPEQREQRLLVYLRGLRRKGVSYAGIAAVLNTAGISTKKGRAVWYAETVRSILVTMELRANGHGKESGMSDMREMRNAWNRRKDEMNTLGYVQTDEVGQMLGMKHDAKGRLACHSKLVKALRDARVPSAALGGGPLRCGTLFWKREQVLQFVASRIARNVKAPSAPKKDAAVVQEQKKSDGHLQCETVIRLSRLVEQALEKTLDLGTRLEKLERDLGIEQ